MRLLRHLGLDPREHPPAPVVGTFGVFLAAVLLVLAPSAAGKLAAAAGWDRRWYLFLVVIPVALASRVLVTAAAFGGWRQLIRLVGVPAQRDLRAGLLGFTLAMDASLLVLVVGRLFGHQVERGLDQYFAAGRPWLFGVIALLQSFVAAPVGEELLARGLVQRSLLDRGVRPIVAIAASSVVFGADHYALRTHDPVQLSAYVGIGAALGWVSWYTGRLMPTMIGHSLFNIVLAVRSRI
ncbi:MAG: lysostaphin resistance A-like protein [Acidimicrobiales bacterium]